MDAVRRILRGPSWAKHAHQVDHRRRGRDNADHQQRQHGLGPPGAQHLADPWLTERGEPPGEPGIVGGEHAFHLFENALLIHRKRHFVTSTAAVLPANDQAGLLLTIPSWKIFYLPITQD